MKRIALILLMASALSVFAWPDDVYVTATVPTNNGGTVVTTSDKFSGTIKAIELNLLSTGTAPTTTIVVATTGGSTGGNGMPGQTIATLAWNTTTNLWLYPMTQGTVNGSAVTWYVPFDVLRESVKFSLTGSNLNTVGFTGRVIYDRGK